MREHLLFTYKFNLQHLESLVKDLTGEQMVRQPHGVVNHPAWTLCHLGSSSNYIAKALGLESTFPADWEEALKAGALPSGDASKYPSRAELLAELTAQHERVAAAVEKADPAFFAKEYPDEAMRKYFPTVGDMTNYMLAAHEGTHIGQLQAWRRAMGLAPRAS